MTVLYLHFADNMIRSMFISMLIDRYADSYFKVLVSSFIDYTYIFYLNYTKKNIDYYVFFSNPGKI